ncbi:phiSA1p31-related protein [Streptomyces sp. NPDC088925]|uniref:phiSA1p31-related protein n=1 Tax=Streptomyces sp. NPDC088925 TaxID=3365914 RepID=UPI0037F1D16A
MFINGPALRTAIRQVRPHAEDVVLLDANDLRLAAVATNGYRLAASFFGGSGRTFQALIPLGLLPELVDLAEGAEWLPATVTLAPERTTLTITGSDDRFLTIVTETQDLKTFPSWRTLLLDAVVATPHVGGEIDPAACHWQQWAEAPQVTLGLPQGQSRLLLAGRQFIGLQGLGRSRLWKVRRQDWRQVLRVTYKHAGATYTLTSAWTDAEGTPWRWTGRWEGEEPVMHLDQYPELTTTAADVITSYGPITVEPS